jgi:hypothetical protein
MPKSDFTFSFHFQIAERPNRQEEKEQWGRILIDSLRKPRVHADKTLRSITRLTN